MIKILTLATESKYLVAYIMFLIMDIINIQYLIFKNALISTGGKV